MARSRYRWFIVFLLFAITVVNYIDRAALSYAIPLIHRDLGLSPAETGGILGAFGLGYAITTLIGGFGRSLETVDGLGSLVANLALYDLPMSDLADYAGRVRAVTPEQVQAAFADHLPVNRASLVIVGPSERREGCGESDQDVKAKAEAALGAGLDVILCVGEPRTVRESGGAIDHVCRLTSP